MRKPFLVAPTSRGTWGAVEGKHVHIGPYWVFIGRFGSRVKP